MATIKGYHGTNTRFTEFRPEYSGTAGLINAEYGEAFFMTDSEKFAADYAKRVSQRNGGTPVVMHVQMTLVKPLSFDFARDDRTNLGIDEDSQSDDVLVQEQLVHRARAAGYDGLICTNFNDGGDERITQYIAFSSAQLEIVRCADC